MVKNSQKMNGATRGRRFLVFGRVKPTEENPNPEIIVVNVFGRNTAFARSRYWKTNRVLNKIKRSQGEILKIQEIFDSGKLRAKNFGIFLKYRSRTGVINCFKEYRDVNLAGAIDQMFNEMGGNYSVNNQGVEIIRTVVLQEDQLKLRNPRCKQWMNTKEIKYPLWKRSARRTHSKYETTFAHNRPVCYKRGVTIE